MAGQQGENDTNAGRLDPRAIEEVIRACLAPRDLESFCTSLGYGAAFGNRERARLLAETWVEDPALRQRISRLLAASTRNHLEQVRLSTEIELEQLALTLDPSSPAAYWGPLWAMSQDGRERVRELACQEIGEFFRRMSPPLQPEAAPEESADLTRQSETTSPALPALSMSAPRPESPPTQPPSPPDSPAPDSPGAPTPSPPSRKEDTLDLLVQEIRLLGQRQMETDSRILALSERFEKSLSETPAAQRGGGDSLAMRALSNLESLMDGLSARQREIKGLTVSELDALRTELRNLSSQEEEARRSLSALSARVVALGNEIRDTRLKETLDRIDGNLNQLITANRRLEAAIGPRDETTRVMLDNLKTSQGELLQIAAVVSERVESLSEQKTPDQNNSAEALAELRAALDAFKSDQTRAIETISGALEQLIGGQSSLGSAIETLAVPNADEDADGAVSALQSRFDALNNRLEDLSRLLSETRDKVIDLERARQESEETITHAIQEAASSDKSHEELKLIEDRVDRFTSLLGEIKSEQSEVRSMLDALASRRDQEKEHVERDSDLLEKLSALHATVSQMGQKLLTDLPAALPATMPLEADPATIPHDSTSHEPQFAEPGGADELLSLREEVQRLQERCHSLERCLDESSRREMDELLDDKPSADTETSQQPLPDESPTPEPHEPTPEPDDESLAKEEPLPEMKEPPSSFRDDTLPSTHDDTEPADEELEWPDIPDEIEQPPQPIALPQTEEADFIVTGDDAPANSDADVDSRIPEPAEAVASIPEESIPVMPAAISQPEAASVPESNPEVPTVPIYHNDLIVLIGGREDYENSYRQTASELGARLERYASLDTLDNHQVADVVSRSDLLILINEALLTSGGVRARQIALDTNRRCFIHHSAQPKSLRRFLVNLVETGQV